MTDKTMDCGSITRLREALKRAADDEMSWAHVRVDDLAGLLENTESGSATLDSGLLEALRATADEPIACMTVGSNAAKAILAALENTGIVASISVEESKDLAKMLAFVTDAYDRASVQGESRISFALHVVAEFRDMYDLLVRALNSPRDDKPMYRPAAVAAEIDDLADQMGSEYQRRTTAPRVLAVMRDRLQDLARNIRGTKGYAAEFKATQQAQKDHEETVRTIVDGLLFEARCAEEEMGSSGLLQSAADLIVKLTGVHPTDQAPATDTNH